MFTLATKFRPEPPAFALAQEAGFAGAEFWLDAAVLAGWQEVARYAKSQPFRYALHFPTKLEQGPETLDSTASLYRAVDCRALVIHQPHAHRYGAALLERAPEMRLAVENHLLSPAAFEEWAKNSPGLALDVEHVWMSTWKGVGLEELLGNVKNFLGRWGEKLRHVHMPGYLPGQDEHRPMYCSRELVLGMFSILDEAGFQELVVSEVEPRYQTANDMRMDVLLYDLWRHQRDGRR